MTFKNDNLPSAMWRMGIINFKPGNDGIPRVTDIKTANEVITNYCQSTFQGGRHVSALHISGDY